MKVFCILMAIFPSLTLAYTCRSLEEHGGKKTKKHTFQMGRSLVIPLLDVGVLWTEEMLSRKKRYSEEQSTRISHQLKNRINVRPCEKEKQLDTSDAFVDSLVMMMSKSDPDLLLKLRRKIEEFGHPLPVMKSQKGEKQRPLIQFFNVTRISVSSSDDDDDIPLNFNENDSLLKLEDNVVLRGKNQERNEAFLEDASINMNKGIDADIEANPKSDISTLLKTKDGQIARIERSKDKKRYRLEIDYNTRKMKTDQLEKNRRKRMEKCGNLQMIGNFVGNLQGSVGSSSIDTFLKGPNIVMD